MSIAFEQQPESWVKSAACRDMPSGMSLFFTSETELEAKKLCKECPVRKDCLGWALRHNEEDGVWGGLSPKERRRMRRPVGMQFGECRYCARLFSYAGDLGPSFSPPVHCSDTCRHEERRAKKRESRERLRLGIRANGG